VQPILKETSDYKVERHGLEGMITDDDRRNSQTPYDAEKDEVLGLSTMIWLDKERGLANTLTDPAVVTQNVTLSGTSQYNDFTNSDPIGDFLNARVTVRDKVGMPPDTAIMDWSVFNTLAYSPKILAALGFTDNRAGQLSEAELSKALGVKRLLVAMSQFNSAKEGQTAVRQNVWGKHIVFAVAPPKAQVYQTSVGYYITLTGETPREVFKFPINNPPNADGIIVQDNYDMFLSNLGAAFLIEDAIA